MNKRAPLILLIVISILLAFTYRFLSSSGKISDPKDEKLYPLTQDQVEWLAKKKELIIAFSDDSSPFITLTPKGGAEGILVDYIGLISSGYDIDVKYISILENDAGQVLNDGIADAALLRHSTELEKDVIFTMPLIKAKGILMFSNDLSLDNSNGGKGYIVSVSGKDPSIDYLHKKFPQMTLLPAKDTEGAVDLLKSGKANSIAGSEAALNYFLDRNYVADNLIKAEGYTFEKNYCLGLAKKNDELYGILNNAIYHMDSVHTITSLQSKWMGVSYTLYRENIIAKIGVIALILLASVLGVFIVFYQSNKSLYEELQQRMELLIESQNEMQTTFDGVSYYLVEVNREGRIIDINKALSQYLKIRRSDAIGLRFTDTFGANSEVTDKLSELIEETFSKDAGRNLEFLVGKGIFEAHSFTVKDTRRKIRKVLLMIEDVTDQRSAERQMLQDNKMIAIGQLAAGVAHEIRNPLGLIRNYCYVLKNIDHDDDETRNEAIKVIEKSVDKSGKIIENLLEFSRITTNKREHINLYNHISNIIDLQKNWLKKRGINITYEYYGLQKATVNSEAIGLILINLISNGAEAITEHRMGSIWVNCIHKENEYIQIKVVDDGEGISKELMGDIFNPFFTTKEKREGNGLGLYIVYNEVSKMHGEIKVDSIVGSGTTFTITIPTDEIFTEGATIL